MEALQKTMAKEKETNSPPLAYDDDDDDDDEDENSQANNFVLVVLCFSFLFDPRCSRLLERGLERVNSDAGGRWKREMLAVTGELQRKIETMHRENCQLRAENNQLKDQLLMVSGSARADGEADVDVDVAVTGTRSAGVTETQQHS
ncbi:AGAP013482-PA-like protein [Anopheles sinensis]|uniref:AGAP013482-PA-like protein n=1 Tax=Anopheles sinensis TaxID=74873 RepID=A0A084VBN0_ANOSI|nr:AGAP013482-PA-like protein [Anopheles sinensis]